MPTYRLSGRILTPDGAPCPDATVTVYERTSLTVDALEAHAKTDAAGRYEASWTRDPSPRAPWDLFVRAEVGDQRVDSPLISDLADAAPRVVDLILGAGDYRGRSEWERLAAKLTPILGQTTPEDVPVDRLEWLARRADVLPGQLGAFVQAHRLAAGRSVLARSCYAFLRGGLPADMPGLLAAGEDAWAGALRGAWDRQILRPPGDGSPAQRQAEVDREVAAMRALAVEAAITRPSQGTNLRTILDTAGLTEAEQRTFNEAWADRSATPVAVWQQLEAALGSAKVADVQFTLRAAALVARHAPALAALQAARASQTITTLEDLAAWSVDDWASFLASHEVPAPEGTPGADAAAKRDAYALGLARAIEDVYPTHALRWAIARDEAQQAAPPHTTGLVGFFADNPGFDVAKTPVGRWLAAHPEALAGAPDPDQLRANLERVQRVYRLTPRLGRYDSVKALLEQGVGSAAQVVGRTREEFVTTIAASLPATHHQPAALAGKIWDKASALHGTTTALLSSYAMGAMGAMGVGPQVLAGVGSYALEGELAELAGIFGTIGGCDCAPCRSVFSPAAYLADLLHFLAERPTQAPGTSALDLLTAPTRRPDLPHLLLDCDNSHTALPTIDLVIEALEALVGGGLGPAAKQTRMRAAELRLHPEHLDAAVYQAPALTEAVYPWTLPFSLAQREAQGYLEHLGLPRARLIDLLVIEGAPPSPTPAERAAEALGLSPTLRSIIAGELPDAGDGRAAWGITLGEATDGWDAGLAADLGELLRRSGLTLAELEGLLRLTFINPNVYGQVGMARLVYGEGCTLADAQLVDADAALLDRLHRVVRLQRATQIPARMLNVLIDDVGGGALDGAFLEALVDMRWLHAATGVEWDALASWWAPRLDARAYLSDEAPALYRRRFCAAELGASPDFAANDRGDALFGEGMEPTPLTEEHVGTILAATGLRRAELDALRDAGLVGDSFGFAAVTASFRAASFARAKRLTIAEFLRLLPLLEIDPFASPAAARSFVARLEELRRGGIAWAQIEGWLRGPATIDDDAAAATLGSLATQQATIDDSERREATAVTVLAAHVGLPPASCRVLLAQVLTPPGGEGALLDLFSAAQLATPAAIDAGLRREDQPGLFAAHDRLHQAAQVIAALDLAADDGELLWYAQHGEGWLDLDALPLRAEDPPASVEGWLRLRRALSLRTLWPGATGVHAQLAAAPSLAEALALLGQHAGWDMSEATGLGYVAAQLGWDDAGVFADERALLRLREIAAAVDRAGVSAAQLWGWVHAPLDLEITAQIKRAARARFAEDESGWAAVAQPLRDRLRLEQREALIAAAGQPRAALAEALLLDVEISPCMLTSRIRQAIAAVQSFVNRAQLGLEPGLRLDAEACARWAWMKSFRVWEANRRVFCYPENWLDPRLRADASPEFLALESALSQGELDDAGTEAALAAYVERLQILGKLEVVACTKAGATGSLWVLGRSQSPPHRYWLRRRSAGRWRAWEPLQLQIDGDNVALLERGGRLYLLWLMCQRSSGPGSAGTGDYDRDRLWLHWVERRHEGWSEVHASDAAIVGRVAAADAEGAIPDNRYHLRLDTATPTTEVRVYVCGPTSDWGYASFRFDAGVMRLRFCGAGLTDDAPTHLSLEYQARFEGQRSVQRAHDFTPLVQGPYHGKLFRAPTRGDARAYLRPANAWRHSEVGSPLFFDDHERAYLLTVTPLEGGGAGESEGAALVPAHPWAGALAPVFASSSTALAAEPAPGKVSALTPKIQQIKDGLSLVEPWALASPGVKPALFELGGELEVIADPQQALAAAQHTASQTQQLLAPEDVADLQGGPFAVRLASFFHPHAALLAEQLASRGVWGLYEPKAPGLLRQVASAAPLAELDEFWINPAIAGAPLPVDDFDFSPTGAYALYNWELFFHAPLLIADKLAADQRGAEAQRWLHAIFNPIDRIVGPEETATSAAWRLRPLVEQAKHGELDALRAMLGIGVGEAEQAAALADFGAQVRAWQAAPFDPHAVAALRPGAHMRAVFMKYLDNLLAWADRLFRQDSAEALDEATVLYLLAAELLGPRPVTVPSQPVPAKSYQQLAAAGLDAFSNAALALENWLVIGDGPAALLEQDQPSDDEGPTCVPLRTWAFCTPQNPKLAAYWDRIEDRLWKLRHCRSIDGATRQLALFQPPIDPALLIQAKAAGVDLAAVLAELDAAPGRHRFRYVHGRATQLCAELQGLSAALLAALEKRDAEALARLRAGHELDLLAAIREVRAQQVEDARQAVASTRAQQAVVEDRLAYYDRLLAGDLSAGERANLELLESGQRFSQAGHSAQIIASSLSLLPNFQIGTGAFNDFGGVQLAGFARGWAEAFAADAGKMSYQAGRALTMAQYGRRSEEWRHQQGQAKLELRRLEHDLAAAKLRLAIAERERDNLERQRAQAQAVDAHLRDKFSNRQLYDWLVGELASLAWQGYALAFDLAKQAEAAYRRELAIEGDSPRLIGVGHWDSLRSGLLAGERLAGELRRLDKAYMDHDRREFELRKNVSLAQLDPAALLRLQETGACSFAIPEALLDLDHPGHVLRRLRSLSLTIPAVVGPYSSLGATLTLLEHAVRRAPGAALEPGDGLAAGERIATSTAVADGGVFQLDFRDERYLPFEYAGAVSSWHLRLPKAVRQFDYRTISDVVISLAFTARDGGDAHRDAVEAELRQAFNAAFADGAAQLVAVHDAFPDAWMRFCLAAPAGQGQTQRLSLPMSTQRLPYFAQREGLEITAVELVMLAAPGIEVAEGWTLRFEHDPEDPEAAVDVAMAPLEGSFYRGVAQLPASSQPGSWAVAVAKGAGAPELQNQDGWLRPEALAGMLAIVRYALKG